MYYFVFFEFVLFPESFGYTGVMRGGSRTCLQIVVGHRRAVDIDRCTTSHTHAAHVVATLTRAVVLGVEFEARRVSAQEESGTASHVELVVAVAELQNRLVVEVAHRAVVRHHHVLQLLDQTTLQVA